MSVCSLKTVENPVLHSANRLSSLSIVIDDFDSAKPIASSQESRKVQPQKTYTRHGSDDSIKKILEEAEERKHQFWKLIDEHSAVIEDLKRIEQLEPKSVCKLEEPTHRS